MLKVSEKTKNVSESNLTHTTIKLPNSLLDEIEKYVGTKGFTSKPEVIKQACREYIDKNPPPKIEKITPPFEHINVDGNGAKILDRKLRTVVQVYITPQGFHCGYDETDNCDHIKYAFEQPDVQEIIEKKIKEGWNLPNPNL